MDELLVLATRAGELLRERGLRLATAESCTGGWIGMAITAVAGSSAWYDRGFITYSNESKRELLGVAPASLERHGSVSPEVAREMAAGALARSAADLAVAVTGIAGPGGGSPSKPVGTVCLAWSRRGGAGRDRRLRFDGDREQVRRGAAAAALDGVIEMLRGPDG